MGLKKLKECQGPKALDVLYYEEIKIIGCYICIGEKKKKKTHIKINWNTDIKRRK